MNRGQDGVVGREKMEGQTAKPLEKEGRGDSTVMPTKGYAPERGDV